MATFEDAAEELVLKLRGLEDEIAESDGKLEALRERVVAAKDDLEEDWTGLTDAAESLLEALREQAEQLDRRTDATLEAVAAAHDALGENVTGARNEVGQAAADLDALAQHARAVEEGVEPLAHDGVEEPAHTLRDRARELEQELGALVDEARSFLVAEIVPAIAQVADDVRDRCEQAARQLAEDATHSLQQVFDEWSGHVDELEEYVRDQGYGASHQHALDVVEYVMEECGTASHRRLEELVRVVELLEGQLKELCGEVERSGRLLVDESGARLLRELEEAKDSADRALAGLDRVRQELAERSFMEA